MRLRVPDDTIVTVSDALQGEYEQNVGEVASDFVLRRGDGVFAYQLAVVVDDLAMEMTEVVRGFDLLASAPRQLLLHELLGGSGLDFAHVPLVLGENGERLAKRDPGIALRDHREAGIAAERVVARIARGLGLIDESIGAISPKELLAIFDRRRLFGKRATRIHSLVARS